MAVGSLLGPLWPLIDIPGIRSGMAPFEKPLSEYGGRSELALKVLSRCLRRQQKPAEIPDQRVERSEKE